MLRNTLYVFIYFNPFGVFFLFVFLFFLAAEELIGIFEREAGL